MDTTESFAFRDAISSGRFLLNSRCAWPIETMLRFPRAIPVETSVANMVQSDRQVGRTSFLEQAHYRKGMLRADCQSKCTKPVYVAK